MSLNTEHWSKPDRGALFVVTGASGTGKTTLVQAALSNVPGLRFSVSATTRPIRTGETEGVDYQFMDRPSFEARVDAGAFLEWAEVYGNLYGSLKAPISETLATGQSILLDIDTKGAEQVRQATEEAVTIFVLPPSLQVLSARLRGRATDSEEVISRRIQEAQSQLSECGRFDYLVINDHLPSAHDQFQAILVAELLRAGRSPTLIQRFTD